MVRQLLVIVALLTVVLMTTHQAQAAPLFNYGYEYDYVSQLPDNFSRIDGDIYFQIVLKNTGSQTWYRDHANGCSVHLGTGDNSFGGGEVYGGQDHQSPFYASGYSGWLEGLDSNNVAYNGRRVLMQESSVATNSYATFRFLIKQPAIYGTIKEYWTPVVEGPGCSNPHWLNGRGMYFYIKNFPYRAQLSSSTPSFTMQAGEVKSMSVQFRNTGRLAWPASLTKLGTVDPYTNAEDYASPFIYQATWLGSSRVVALSSEVAVDSYGTFNFTIQAPSASGTYKFRLRPLVEGQQWMNDDTMDVSWMITVEGGSTVNQAPTIPQTISANRNGYNSYHFTWKRSTDDDLPLGRIIQYTVQILREDGVTVFASESNLANPTDPNIDPNYDWPFSSATSMGTYKWRVRARDGEKESDWSNLGTFSIGNLAPSKPTITDYELFSYNQMKLMWNHSMDDGYPNTLRYMVEVFDANNVKVATVLFDHNLTNNHYEWPFIPAVQSGNFTWHVKAFDGQLESDWSDWGTFTVKPPEGINLTVSIYKTVNTTERAAYEAIFGHFADAIYEMTNGKHTLGTITVYQNQEQWNNAHVQWYASYWPKAQVSGYGKNLSHVFMGDIFPFASPYNALANPKCAGYALAHEWGHYYYGLYDEYKNTSTEYDNLFYFPHSDDLEVTNSVMNSQWYACRQSNGLNWLNFSIAKNNTKKNAQHRVFGASGWETLARPIEQDPRDGERQAMVTRLYYPELAAAMPGNNQDAPIELPSNNTRLNLHINWITPSARQQRDHAPYHARIISVLGDNLTYPTPLVVMAFAENGAFIAKAGLQAQGITPSGGGFAVGLKDDGIAPDVMANDGLYSGVVPYQQNGTYQLNVTFDNNLGQAEFTEIAHAHAVGPNGETFSDTPQPLGENFSASATTSIIISGYQSDDHANLPQNATELPLDNTNVAGHIDSAGDLDLFKVTPTDTGSLVVRITNLSAQMKPRLRLLDSDGVTLISNHIFTPTANAYFFTTVSAKSQQPFFVEISHTDSNATTGYYDISVGMALSSGGEQNEQSNYQPGDLNGDNALNIFDLQKQINLIMHTPKPDTAFAPLEQWQRADLRPLPSGDGQWNVFDLQALINLIMGRATARVSKPLDLTTTVTISHTSTDLTLNLQNQVAVASGEIWLDTHGVTITQTQLTSRTPNFEVVSEYQNNQLHILFYNMQGKIITPGEGAVVELFGKINLNQPIIITKALLADSNGDALPVSWLNGSRVYLPLMLK